MAEQERASVLVRGAGDVGTCPECGAAPSAGRHPRAFRPQGLEAQVAMRRFLYPVERGGRRFRRINVGAA
jgi:hypothetical protein